MKVNSPHQYIDRNSQQIVTEQLIGDQTVQFLYNSLRENAPTMFRALTSKRMSGLLSYFHYDYPGATRHKGQNLFKKINADWQECVEPLTFFNSPRKVFERQIKYWQFRPMEKATNAIVSPADCRIIIGSLQKQSTFHIKEKLFSKDELLGTETDWYTKFDGGDFCVCRLTPDKYHYNHVPVSGKVVDIYSLDGHYHSCNPTATIAIASIYSKNRRIVTIIDTDIEGGSQIGLVAMVEIVALMIGDVQQAYSDEKYDNPQPVTTGMFLKKGSPKSLYRPGSSTDVLIFEPDRIAFTKDLQDNSRRQDVISRFTNEQGVALNETDITVRSTIAYKLNN
jgi:phosphatidylserine decarboxylase